MARTGAAPKNESGVGRYLLRPEAYRTLFGLMRRKGLKVVPSTSSRHSTTVRRSTSPVVRESCTRRAIPKAAARSGSSDSARW